MFFQALITRIRKGSPTESYPQEAAPKAPKAFTGAPVLSTEACLLCSACTDICPTGAVTVEVAPPKWQLQYDKCTLCGLCIGACPNNALTPTGQYELAVLNRADLLFAQQKTVTKLSESSEVACIGA